MLLTTSPALSGLVALTTVLVGCCADRQSVLPLGHGTSSVEHVPMHAAGETIGYQLHSWNDLDEWQQGLRKGGTHLKMDPHYLGEELCYNITGIRDSRGCFAFNHDTPVWTGDETTQRKYFTVKEFVDLLASAPVRPYIDRGLAIAFCFKDAPSCPSSSSSEADKHAFEAWRSLVDDLFHAAEGLQKSFAKRIEFVLDGSGTNECVRDRWRPWILTYIPGSDPEEAMTSDNVTLNYDRYQALDPSANPDELQKLMLQDYGKFQTLDQPFFIWEPEDQKDFEQLSDIYLSGHAHAAGYKFAINIDPVMFELYLGPRTGRTLHQNLTVTGETKNTMSPKLPTHLSLTSGEAVPAVVHTRGEDDVLRPHLIKLSKPTSTGPGDLHAMDSPIEAQAAFNDDGVTSVSVIGDLVLLSDSTGMYATMSLVNGSTLHTGSLQPQSTDAISTTDMARLDPEHEGVVVRALATTDQLSLILYSMDDISGEVQTEESNVVIISGDDLSFSLSDKVASMSLSVAVATADVCEPHLSAALSILLALHTEEKEVHTITACLSVDHKSPSNSPQRYRISDVVSKWIGVGTRPDVSVTNSPSGELWGALVWTDSYCFNSHEHNTRSNTRICTDIPQSTARVMSYAYGRLTDFSESDSVKGPTTPVGYVTPCHHSLFFGSYDQGSAPSGLLININDALALFELHNGLVSGDVDEGKCGLPHPSTPIDGATDVGGIVVDMWLLPDSQTKEMGSSKTTPSVAEATQ